ncbi:MAG: bifunctional 2-C-methyl-D-erythritol 4-phosphate cytidylyltransferase/2-C-methyl-D-erythritol 2,4-cyclodiphosphate synthase [Kordiimonas sp.]|nr:bifunctional 2-C-methyl-D-erythritol 4-phosphate cytidylyltransferase/2-C-methyl-D-erythritol 2,4-cyclodiphosphate synthase [Kordiimonas sp.]|tara:strand:+ start:7320 stop:8480 length:1161 start_codon:yes stop_codon:yes gene_type:complete
MTIAALIVAAGRGHRVGGNIPKQYLPLGEKTVLYHTISCFLNHPEITHVQVVIHPDDNALYEKYIDGLCLAPPVHGGQSRQESVRFGLDALTPMSPDIVLIHDAARPFCNDKLISDVIEKVRTNRNAIPAMPIVDTLKRAEGGVITATVNREQLYRVQTPQGFMYKDICAAHHATTKLDLTDDAAVMENAGYTLHIVTGHQDNYKITTSEDLMKAQDFMRICQETRTGMGYDVHAFEPGNQVTLCGVTINHDKSLKGHSDADVAMHALTDALFGALGAGDIGDHFPPSDAKWKGAPSEIFLKKAIDLVRAHQGQINHVDLTIICEAPKISPHRDDMRERLSEIMSLPVGRISVKATTTERLGFTGRKEGIAAQAIATIQLPRPKDK